MTTDTPARLVAKSWGRQLRTARRAKFATQEAFAAALQRDQSWISRYERGEATWTPEVMLLFAATLDRPVAELFAWPYGVELMEQYRLGIAA